jgi:hypothetical protein
MAFTTPLFQYRLNLLQSGFKLLDFVHLDAFFWHIVHASVSVEAFRIAVTNRAYLGAYGFAFASFCGIFKFFATPFFFIIVQLNNWKRAVLFSGSAQLHQKFRLASANHPGLAWTGQ